jgi:hypothetical protein
MSEPTRPAMTMRQIRERLGYTIPPDAPALPAAWVDGDPLMEAIAAVVWEHCETDGLSLVIDDPRNIAATAAAVARASSSAPADGAELRDRIRRAVCEAEGFAWDSDMLEPDEYGEVADAVLAVLPAPAETEFELRGTAEIRGAALTEAADFLRGMRLTGTAISVEEIEAALRRLAGEARDEREGQAETGTVADEAQQPAGAPCGCGHPVDEHSVYGCADGCACEWMPKRPPMDPVHILGIGAPAAAGQQPEAAEGAQQ